MPGFTNTREDGLETLIVRWLTDHNGYEEGTNADYDKEYAVEPVGVEIITPSPAMSVKCRPSE